MIRRRGGSVCSHLPTHVHTQYNGVSSNTPTTVGRRRRTDSKTATRSTTTTTSGSYASAASVQRRTTGVCHRRPSAPSRDRCRLSRPTGLRRSTRASPNDTRSRARPYFCHRAICDTMATAVDGLLIRTNTLYFVNASMAATTSLVTCSLSRSPSTSMQGTPQDETIASYLS
jgi:hypothetical protein